MSEDHGPAALRPTDNQPAPLFLSVTPGQFVVVKESQNVVMADKTTWSIAEVIWCEGDVLCNPAHTTISQVMDVDSGVVRWVNADRCDPCTAFTGRLGVMTQQNRWSPAILRFVADTTGRKRSRQ